MATTGQERGAHRAGAAVALAMGVVLSVQLVLRPPQVAVPGPWLGWVAVGVLLGAGVLALCRPQRLPAWAWPVATAGGAVWVAALRPLFPDTPGVAYAVLTLLVLLAAGWQGRTASRATLVAAVGAVGVVGATSHPPAVAALHVVVLSGVLVLLHLLVGAARGEQARVVRELEARASRDEVTGLLSRSAFRLAARAAVEAVVASRGDVALVLVDVDHFKAVNDTHGHPVGDAALRHVAQVVQAGVRSPDAVVARLGGDELAVLLPGCPRSAALARAQDLVAAVRRHPLDLPTGGRLTLRISAGAALAPEHGDDLDALYAAADAALYAAKRAGRDRAAVAGPLRPGREPRLV